jgi:hypothetical protein
VGSATTIWRQSHDFNFRATISIRLNTFHGLGYVWLATITKLVIANIWSFRAEQAFFWFWAVINRRRDRFWHRKWNQTSLWYFLEHNVWIKHPDSDVWRKLTSACFWRSSNLIAKPIWRRYSIKLVDSLIWRSLTKSRYSWIWRSTDLANRRRSIRN